MKGLFTSLTCFCLILPFCSTIYAQVIHPADGELFREDVIPRIDIFLPVDSLDWMLDPANLSSNHHVRAMFIFDNGTMRDTVEDVGFRLRGNTSRSSAKKSFKVSFNTFESGRNYQGVEKLNLNGEHNDPSVSRAKVCWDLARDIAVPAARSNHVKFYINNAFRGVYLNVEHIDEEFVKKRFGNNGGNLYKCLWPADLNYLGSNPNLYKGMQGDRRTYALKTNTAEDDYSDLAHFIDILNNTALNDLPCELEQIFHVDNYLKSIALDILTGNWDGPIFNKNNFYLYHNLESGQFEYIPYDLDNTLGIDWFNIDWSTRNIYSWSPGSEARPIYDRLMQVQEYKDRYSFYLNEIISSHYQSTSLFPRLDHFKNSLDSLIALDSFYPIDYGFSTTDFQQSFEMALPYNHTDAGLKPFITARRNAVLNQLSLNDIPPIIYNIQHNRPDNQENIEVQVSIQDDNSVNAVEFCYYTTDPNSVTCVSMKDDGMNLDGQAGDGLYGVIISSLNQAGILHYFIKATDDQGQESLLPRCGMRKLFVGRSNISLAIN
ncbi:MAG: CotH kinase family protein [Bacteroidota bacterium]